MENQMIIIIGLEINPDKSKFLTYCSNKITLWDSKKRSFLLSISFDRVIKRIVFINAYLAIINEQIWNLYEAKSLQHLPISTDTIFTLSSDHKLLILYDANNSSVKFYSGNQLPYHELLVFNFDGSNYLYE